MASGLPELLVQPNGFLDVIHDLLMPETDWSGPKSATSTGSPSRPPELLLDPCRHRHRRRTLPRRCTSSPRRRRLRLPPRPRLPRALQPLVRPPPSPLPRSRRMPRAASSVVLVPRASLCSSLWSTSSASARARASPLGLAPPLLRLPLRPHRAAHRSPLPPLAGDRAVGLAWGAPDQVRAPTPMRPRP